MSLPAEWFDPVTGRPSGDGDAARERAERAERATRADAAVVAARAARASLTASAAGAVSAAGPAVLPAPDLEVEPTAPPLLESPVAERYGNLRLTTGVLGRTVLAFVAGCLVITLLPLVIGWRPYVVKSGSMEPRIKVGDVVLASPDHDSRDLLGHVTVFDDPALPGAVKSHRVIAVNPDGSMTTKGDANPTADPVHLQDRQVRGIGRLLVRWAGLPLVWAMTGQFLLLGLFLLGLGVAAWAVARDHEDDDDEDDENDENDDEDEDDEVAPVTRAEARRVVRLERRAQRRRTAVVRATFGLVGATALLVPGTSAAFSATTRTTGSSWTVPAYSYPTTVTSIAPGVTPYLYWKLGEATGVSSAADSSGSGHPGTYAGTYSRNVPGGTPDTTPNAAVTATTSTACVNTTSTTAIAGPAVFTEIIWFKTAAGYTGGGKLIGFETPRTGVGVAGSGGNYDRHLYMDGAGKVWFGVYNGADRAASTSAAYNDGAWHMAAATISSAGMALYVDGVLRDTDTNNAAEASTGWWRVGCGNLSGWGAEWTGANNPGTDSSTTLNKPFLGSLDEATVYAGTALTAAQVGLLYWTR